MTQQITRYATILMGLTILFWIYWIARSGGWVVRVSADIELWRSIPLVENHADITWTPRALYAGVFGCVILLGSICTFWALRLMNLIRQGHYFTHRSTATIRTFGVLLVLSMLSDWCLNSLDQWFFTWNNTATPAWVDGTLSQARPILGPQLELANSQITIALCGLGFALLGYVLQVARQIEDENRSYV